MRFTERLEAALFRHEWNGFMRIWQCIAVCESARHNLLVMTHAETTEARETAAKRIAETLAATLFVALSAVAGGAP